MEFAEVVRRRHMSRTFNDRAVPGDVLDRVLDAAVRSPTAGNCQGVVLVVLASPDERDLFWSHVHPSPPKPGGRWHRLQRAPVIVLPVGDKTRYLDRYAEPDKAGLGLDTEGGWSAPYWEVDAAFAAMSLLLAATDAGLGALFFAVARGREGLRAALGIPNGAVIPGAVAVGYSAAGPRSPSLERPRRPMGELVRRGHWGR